MVTEATLIISRNLNNSDMRRKREILKNVWWMCDRRFFKKSSSSRNAEPEGHSISLKEQLSFINYFESWAGARHCLRFLVTQQCTKQSPSSRGSPRSGRGQIKYRQGWMVESVLDRAALSVLLWWHLSKNLNGMEDRPNVIWKLNTKSKTICVKRQINKEETHINFKRLYWYIFPASVLRSPKGMGFYLETGRSTPLYYWVAPTFGFLSIKPRRKLQFLFLFRCSVRVTKFPKLTHLAVNCRTRETRARKKRKWRHANVGSHSHVNTCVL